MKRILLLIGVEEPYRAGLYCWANRNGIVPVAVEPETLSSLESGIPILSVAGLRNEGEASPARLRLLRKGACCPLVFLARSISIDCAVRLIRWGASDVIGVPVPVSDLVARVVAHAAPGQRGRGAEELIGESQGIRKLRQEIEAVAPLMSTVLITGETGSGKGVAARAIHRLSERKDEPFVHLDCAALASSVIESEFFGHERGAFTGAVAPRAGCFERAQNGTIFLDEIGELPVDVQGKLLRILHDREFERIGGDKTFTMSARVIAATNRDLGSAVARGNFRGDLWFRLNVFLIHVPPLRERLGDLPALVRAGLAELSDRLDLPTSTLSDEFYAELGRYDWPGNVRELMNVLERVIIRERAGLLDERDLSGMLVGPTHVADPSRTDAERTDAEPGTRADRASRSEITAALTETGGNIARSARRLGVARSTLRYRILVLGLGHLIPRD